MLNPRMEIVSIVSIWGSPNPYGDSGMEINNASTEEEQHIQRGGEVGKVNMDQDNDYNNNREEEGANARTHLDE